MNDAKSVTLRGIKDFREEQSVKLCCFSFTTKNVRGSSPSESSSLVARDFIPVLRGQAQVAECIIRDRPSFFSMAVFNFDAGHSWFIVLVRNIREKNDGYEDIDRRIERVREAEKEKKRDRMHSGNRKKKYTDALLTRVE